MLLLIISGLPVSSLVKNPPANAGNARDMGSIPGSGGSPGGGNGNPLQYSCLENSVDTRAWQATVHVVAKSWTQHTHTNYINIFPLSSLSLPFSLLSFNFSISHFIAFKKTFTMTHLLPENY